jgi:hypothetical protein
MLYFRVGNNENSKRLTDKAVFHRIPKATRPTQSTIDSTSSFDLSVSAKRIKDSNRKSIAKKLDHNKKGLILVNEG